MLKFFSKRLIGYPILFSVLWTTLYLKFPEFYLIKLTQHEINSLLTQTIPFDLSIKTKFTIFGFVFGYIYGTLSTVISVSKFRGIVFLLVFFFKVMFSITFALSIGYIAFIIEIATLPLVIFFIKKFKNVHKTKKQKMKKTNGKEREKLLCELELLLKQYKSA